MRKIIRAAVLVAVLAPLCFVTPAAAQSGSIDDLNRQLEAQKYQIQQRQQQQQAAQDEALFAITQLDVTQAQIEDVDDQLKQVNAWVAAAKGRLGAVDLARVAAEAQVADAQRRAAEVEDEIAAIQYQLQGQVVEIYLDLVYEPNFLIEDGDPNRNARRQFYVEELGADAQVLIDRLRRAYDDQEALVLRAEQAQAEINQAEADLNTTLAQLDELIAAQEKLQGEWNLRRDTLQIRVDEEAEIQAQLENEIAGFNQNIANIENEIERREAAIAAEQARRARETEIARLADLERREEGGGTGQFAEAGISTPPEFLTPVVGSVVSGFGNRVHPIFGTVRFHAGLDFNNNMGDDILAAASGTVTHVGWREGYGHTVVIDHGGGWTTLYAHLSQYRVNNGEQVTVGDLIGLVGSTGWSTGPHLHFEIRYLGSPRDPANYLKL